MVRALQKVGLGDAYFDQLAPWEYMLNQGLTTFGETDKNPRSDCHGWSATPSFDFLHKLAEVLFSTHQTLAGKTTATHQRLSDDIHYQELQLAKKSAVEANVVKSQIIANTSHELLTPLNVISGFTQKLLADNSINHEQRHKLARIDENTQHLSALVNDLLAFSVHGDHGFSLNYRSFDIYALLESIGDSFRESAQHKNISIIYQFDELRNTLIKSDPLRLRDV